MKNFKKFMALLLAAVMLIGAMSGCSKKAEDTSNGDSNSAVTNAPTADTDPYATHLKFTMSAVDAEKAGLTENGEPAPNFKWLCDKFNVEFEFWPLTWDNYVDQTRMWLNSDSAPDIIMLDVAPTRYSEYLSWVDAGLFKAYPDFANYPDLASHYDKMTTGKMFSVNGSLYAWPAYMDSDKYDYVQALGYMYRKDWAKAVGLYNDNGCYTWDQWLNLVKTVQAQDPGKNGAGNTIGIITAPAWGFPKYVTGSISPKMLSFTKDASGTWVWGSTLPETLDAIKTAKQMYDDGLVWSDQPMVQDADAGSNFNAGKVFATTSTNTIVPGLDTAVKSFKDANPDVNPEDAIGLAAVSGPDGKYLTYQSGDQWSQTAMNHKISDEKAQRWTTILDYLVSDEGYYFRNFGIPSVDWKYDDSNNVVCLWSQKDENGNLVNPYWYGTWPWARAAGCTDGFALVNPAYPQWERDAVTHLLEIYSGPDAKIIPLDPKVAFFVNDDYNNATAGLEAETYQKIAEFMTSKDIATDWANWVDQKKAEVQPAVDALNANLK